MTKGKPDQLEAVWRECSVVVDVPSRLLSGLETSSETEAIKRVKRALFALSAALNGLMEMLSDQEREEVSVSLIRRST